MKTNLPPRGLALLLVMWALFIMSFAIIGLLFLLKVDIGNTTGLERAAVAASLAHAGVTMGRNTDFPIDGKPEAQSFPDGGSLEVTAVSENSKLHINRLLASGQRDTLRALFRIWELSDSEADTVLDCLFDYVEPGPNRRLNGAKAPQYRAVGRSGPPGRPFLSIDEMAGVLKFDLVMKRKPNWREYFTVYGNGTLDLTTASPDVIRAVCRVGESSARAVNLHGGEFDDLDAVRAAMGLTEKEFNGLKGTLSLGGNVRRVRSTGTFAQAKRTIEAVCQVDNGQTLILDWREW